MFRSIYEDIQNTFRSGNMIHRIILINVGIWIAINLLYVFTAHSGVGSLYHEVLRNTALASEISTAIKKPWTLLTHMFLHKGFWHILWNMLLLLWFGRIVGDLIGDKKILPLYLYGGLFGALIYMLAINNGLAQGASAAVMAVVVAAAVVAPDYIMRLILIGDIKIKYIALVIVFLDVIGTAGNVNTGGHYAHLGGAAFGWIYISLMRQGLDLSVSFNSLYEKILEFFNKFRSPQKSHLKVRYKANQKQDRKPNRRSDDLSFQDRLDRILDKIKQEGYDNLTDDEKEFLYQASKKE